MKPWIRIVVLLALLLLLPFPIDVITAFLWWALTERTQAYRRR